MSQFKKIQVVVDKKIKFLIFQQYLLCVCVSVMQINAIICFQLNTLISANLAISKLCISENKELLTHACYN